MPIEVSRELSAWRGWDQNNLPWSEAKHKDAVCYAAFGESWSMEDAAELIGFIDRTWTGRSSPAASIGITEKNLPTDPTPQVLLAVTDTLDHEADTIDGLRAEIVRLREEVAELAEKRIAGLNAVGIFHDELMVRRHAPTTISEPKPIAWWWEDKTGCVHLTLDRPDVFTMAREMFCEPQPLYGAPPPPAGLEEKAGAFDKIVAVRKAFVDAANAYNERLKFVNAERSRGNWSCKIDSEAEAMRAAQSLYHQTVQSLTDAALSPAKEAE